jgi:hypothetical protein
MADNIDPKNFAKAFADVLNKSSDIRAETQITYDLIKDQAKYLNNQATLRNEILAASKKLYEVSRDINDIDQKDLGTLQAKKDIDKQIEKALQAQKTLGLDLKVLDKDRSELSFNLQENLKKQISTNEKNITLLKEQASLNKEIAGYSISFDIIAAAVERIGGKASVIAGPFRNMAEASRETARDLVLQNKAIADKKALLEKVASGEISVTKEVAEQLNLRSKSGKLLTGKAGNIKVGSELGTLTKDLGPATGKFNIFIKSLGAGFGAIGKMIKGIPLLGWIVAAIDAAKELIAMMSGADAEVTKFAKSLYISKGAAAEVRQELYNIASESELISYDHVSKAFTNINQQLGTSIDLTQDFGQYGRDLVKQYAEFNNTLGLSEETLNKLTQLSVNQGKTLNESYDAIAGTVVQMGLERGYMQDVNQVISEVAATSNEVRGYFGGSVEQLTKAVLRAKYLGVELSEAVSISQGLLDFQGGIQKELEAEVLIQKDINLDKARSRALAGDELGATSAILAELGRIRKSRKLNVLEEKALVEAGGLSYDQYKKILVQQQEQAQLKKLSLQFDKEGVRVSDGLLAQAKKIVDEGKVAGKTTAQINKEVGTMVRQQAQQQSAADKFALAMSKVKDTFMKMVDGGFLDKFADMIIEIAKQFSAGGIKGVLFGLSDSQKLDAATEQVRNLKKSYGQQTGVTIGTLADAQKLQEDGKLTQEQVNELAEAIAEREKIKASRKATGSTINTETGESTPIYADDFIIRPGQAPIKFNKDDLVMGGTSLLGGGDSTKIDRMISLLEQLVNTKGSVYIDGARVGDALVMGTYRSV